MEVARGAEAVTVVAMSQQLLYKAETVNGRRSGVFQVDHHHRLQEALVQNLYQQEFFKIEYARLKTPGR
jgi:hypothetical protein